MHHIVSDGWSLGVLVGELGVLYAAFRDGKPSPLAPLPLQYPDVAVSQRQRLSNAGEQLAYWRTRLGSGDGGAGAAPVLGLPTDRPRPPVQTYRGADCSIVLPAALLGQLEGLGQRADASLFMVLLAGLQALLGRYSGQDDVVVGTFIANRTRPELEALIGCFVNTLALRTDLSADPSFRELLARVRETCVGAYAHQEIPFERLLAELQPERDLSRTPLFQAMLVLQDAPGVQLELPEVTCWPLQLPTRRSNFDLTLWAAPQAEPAGGLELRVEYATDLFDQATIQRLLRHYQTLLEAAACDPEAPLSALSLLNDAERQQVLVDWNATTRDYTTAGLCLQELFEQQAARTPEATAVLEGGQRLTYRQLNARANQLAHHLRTLGVGPEVVVGVCLERSIDAVVAILGVLKAGGAYLPLDPAHPTQRLAFLLRDAQAGMLLTREGLLDQLPTTQPEGDGVGTGPQVVLLDADWPAVARHPDHNPPTHPDTSPANLAYLIYTSGSTGTPKGVLGVHRGMVNCLSWLWETYPLEEGEVAVQRTSLSFVDAVWELLTPLLAGVPVVIAPDEVVKDPERFVDLLAAHRVTRLVAVPSLLRVLLHADVDLASRLRHLRYCFSSGEALSLDLYRRFTERLPEATLVNVYGTSEVSADATCHDTSQNGTLPCVPIGRPLANTQVYLLDVHLQPVPVGVPGEICVGGIGLARGYRNYPDLTTEKFIRNPFSDDPDARLYRTGDLGRFLADGSIAYLGRADHQVKLRGFRIELGEIEAVLAQHERVRDAAVVVRGQGEDDRLIAYIVPADAGSPISGAMRAFLKERLPEYMIPSMFVALDALPLTVTGKVDRMALPDPESVQAEPERLFVAPRTPTEEALAGIFAELLGVERVSTNDDFFELGGHSLRVIELLTKVRNEFQVEFPMRVLYETSTVASLAEAIETIRHSGIGAAPTALNAVANFAREATLDPEIRPEEALPYTPVAELSDVFLTGGTGFLGVHLLYELLEQTQANVHCLVRAPSADKGKLRLKEKLEANHLWDPSYGARIVPVLGDLSKRCFGLSQERFDTLATTVQAIYHSGAYVNFIFPYSALKAATVTGTQEAIRLASRITLKPLHHISLTDVALHQDSEGRWVIDEEPAVTYPRGIFMSGYAQTKWVAERLVALAQARGLPVTIYRPGFIEGHSQTGFCNTTSELCLTLKGCIQLGYAPDHPFNFDAAPVDYASKAFVYLSRQPGMLGRIFNAVNPNPVPLHKVTGWIDAAGYPLQRVPYQQWRQKVLEVVANDPGHPLYSLLPYSVDEEIARMPLAFPTDCSNTLAGLEDSGISCPPIEPKLLETCLSYLAEVGFLEPPQAQARTEPEPAGAP